MGSGEGNGEDGVRAEAGLIFGSVKVDHGLVDEEGVASIEADDGRGDFLVDVLDRGQDAFAAVDGFVAIAELEGFAGAGGSARGGRAAPDGAVGESDFRLNGRVAAGIDDLAAIDFDDFGVHVD